jgi:hypothetical protein
MRECVAPFTSALAVIALCVLAVGCSPSQHDDQQGSIAGLRDAGKYLFDQLYAVKGFGERDNRDLATCYVPLLPGTEPPRDKGTYLYFTNSTSYLLYLMESGIIEKESPFFDAVGPDRHMKSTPASFTAEHNPWSVVAGFTSTMQSPLFFTRNLKINSLADPLKDARLEGFPLGTSGVVVVYENSRVVFITKADIPRLFNQSGATNVVLRP